MARELDPDLVTLINSGSCEDHTTLVLTLGDGVTVLRLATAELLIDGETFTAALKDSQGLKMSLDRVTDRIMLVVQNVDTVFGQLITASESALEGATGVLGIAFVDGGGTVFYDEKLSGDVIAGAIDENEVELNFVADIYAALVVGETVASVFPYMATPPTEIVTDPNDLGPGGDPGGDSFGGFGIGNGGGINGGRLPPPMRGF